MGAFAGSTLRRSAAALTYPSNGVVRPKMESNTKRGGSQATQVKAFTWSIRSVACRST